METIKNVSLGIINGLWDSFSGMTMVLHIDAEIHRLNAEEEAERKKRDRRIRRSPSPVPSSAAAMAREEQVRTPSEEVSQRTNADERSIDSIRKKPKPPEKQTPKPEKKIAKKVLKCCLLNGGFTWASIILFEQILLPVVKFVVTIFYGKQNDELHTTWGWVQPILSILFSTLWVLPIFLLSKIVSSLWFTDIANAAYRVRKGQPQFGQGISKIVADFLFNLIVQALFLVQSMLVNMIPYLGSILCFFHLSLLYSLYSFEYKWFNMGWELHRRLSYIENNWPYFLGFGIPLTLITSMSSSLIVSSCIFSIFFPLFILSGNEAKPLIGTTNQPLRLFAPVIFVANLFFNRGGRSQKITALRLAQQQQQQQQQQLQKQQYQQQMLQDQMSRPQRQMHTQKFPQQQQHRQQQQQHRQYNRESPIDSRMQSPTYRYQQPPQTVNPQLHTSNRPSPRASPMRHTPDHLLSGRYMGGMTPLVPTPVPGAPQPPAGASIAPAGASSSVHHR